MAKKTKIQTYHHVHVHVQLKTCECLAGLMTKIIETSTVLLHHPRSGCLCKRLQRRGQWSSAPMSKLAFALPAAQVHWAHDSGTNHRHTIAWHSFHVKFERQSGGECLWPCRPTHRNEWCPKKCQRESPAQSSVLVTVPKNETLAVHLYPHIQTQTQKKKRSILHTPHFPLYTLHFTHYTLNSKLPTPHFTRLLPHFTLDTLASTLYTPHYTPHTLHFTHYT